MANRVFTRMLCVAVPLTISLLTFAEENEVRSGVAALSESEERTLDSIEQIGDYHTYVMTYYGDYGFENYLAGGEFNREQQAIGSISCSTFSAYKNNGDTLFGYNQDCSRDEWSLIIFADSPTGYASVSIVRGDFCYIEAYMANRLSSYYRDRVLEAVYYPFDGMNEHGVTMSPMYVPGESVWEQGKRSLHGLSVIRLVLDYARDVDEAVELIRQYNNSMADEIHYLVSDAHGDSAVVEYFDGGVVVTRTDEPWQVCTNTRICGNSHNYLMAACGRYGHAYSTLQAYDGRITEDIAFDILESISFFSNNGGTLWSSVYNKTTGEWRFCLDRNYDDVFSFEIPMVVDLEVKKASARLKKSSGSGKVVLKARVVNNSPRLSSPAPVKFYLSKKDKLGKKAVFLGSRRLPVLAAGAKEVIKVTRALPKGVKPGDYYLIATVDEKGRNHDTTQDNNMFVKANTISIIYTHPQKP